MIILLSPAKTLDESPTNISLHSTPRMLTNTTELIKVLRKKSAEDIKKLMKVSDNIANLNVGRYKDFHTPFDSNNAKQALLAFQGDVYRSMNTATFDEADLKFAQRHLRILSGLYGLLKPMDLIQPYRLEMGTRLENKRGKNLYQFWDTHITKLINEDLKAQEGDVVINLASKEYYKSVKPKAIKGNIYQINFKENRNGEYKLIGVFAKKGRGYMASYIIKNRLTMPDQLKEFDVEGYQFNEELSSEFEFIFTR